MHEVRFLVVNADDFGYHKRRNVAVADLLERGLLTSATILLNQPGTAFAVEYAQASKRRCFGLHLNLSEGTALSAARPLLASELRSVTGIPRLLVESRFYAREIDAQCARATAAFEPTHVDGHFHIHTHPPFWPAIAASTKRHGISRIRRYFTHALRDRSESLVKKSLKSLFDRYMLEWSGLRTTDFFFDVSYFLDHYEQLKTHLPADCSVEIQTHPEPGNRDDQLLRSDRFRTVAGDFSLVSYDQI